MGILRMWRVCGLARKGTRDRDLLDPSGFVEAQPWRTRADAGRVALAEVDEEDGVDGRALEADLVELREIGREAGVERVWEEVTLSGVFVRYKNKQNNRTM